MTLADFINKYNGKKVDFDNAFGAQCVDLFRQYCREVLEIPHTGAVEGAKDLFLKYYKMEGERKYFSIHSSGLFAFGDVAIWDGNEINKYGHVALFLAEVDRDNILVFEQNGLKQDGAKLAIRSKKNLLGVLRRKLC